MPRRTDHNQRDIVKALRDVGASVQDTHMVGHGFGDIVVGFRGKNFLIECKRPGGTLTGDEEKFHLFWNGKIDTVHTIDEAMMAIGEKND